VPSLQFSKYVSPVRSEKTMALLPMPRRDADPSVLTVVLVGVGRSGDENVFAEALDFASQHVGEQFGWASIMATISSSHYELVYAQVNRWIHQTLPSSAFAARLLDRDRWLRLDRLRRLRPDRLLRGEGLNLRHAASEVRQGVANTRHGGVPLRLVTLREVDGQPLGRHRTPS
jgi:hypothetical protein